MCDSELWISDEELDDDEAFDEAFELPKPTHAILGRLPCGCLTAAASYWTDNPELNDGPNYVGEWLHRGLTITMVTWAEYHTLGEAPVGCVCQGNSRGGET